MRLKLSESDDLLNKLEENYYTDEEFYSKKRCVNYLL